MVRQDCAFEPHRISPTLDHSFKTGRSSLFIYRIQTYEDLSKARRQRNTLQSKEQNKISEKELKEMDISKLPDKELEGTVIKILTELGSGMDEHSKNFATGR